MISIAIPTYNRDAVLVETVERLLALTPPADEILIVDQTVAHPPEIEAKLAALPIRWIRLAEPSIPKAMNVALREARSSHVLFLDDDVIPSPSLVAEHAAAHTEGVWAVVGQVLQPGEEPAHFDEATLRRGLLRDLEFRFRHDTACDVQNVMAGNLSVDREKALSIGGFDEQFIAVAYRFESDFALRIVKAGGRIRYEPRATLRHLKAPSGGVRAYGDHRTSAHPAHSVGDYYFALKHLPRFWPYALQRLRKNVLTRYHLTHPWQLPSKITGELRGIRLARKLLQGER
ncbi:MAG TPA: glycosyltransferase [Thermoanaerobaculia bacterium]|jgi:GT2 family glycosyltransferase